MNQSNPCSNEYLQYLPMIAQEDVAKLNKAQESYGNSWKRRGGQNAFFMLIRKIDRMEIQCEKHHNDIFKAITEDRRPEGIIDDIRDLRRYLMLVEAEMIACSAVLVPEQPAIFKPQACSVTPGVAPATAED